MEVLRDGGASNNNGVFQNCTFLCFESLWQRAEALALCARLLTSGAIWKLDLSDTRFNWLKVNYFVECNDKWLTRIGFFMYDVARRLTPAGHVALVMIVCRSGRMSMRILRISGSKPRSSMRSASSNIRYVTLLTSIMLLEMRSFSRPGVATTISTPWVMMFICSLRLPPP